jgi:uncharacterized membrane protein
MLITKRTIFIYVLLVVLLFVIDMSAIQLFFMKPYQNMLRNINPSRSFSIRIIPVILFYLLLALGLFVFVYPKISGNDWIEKSIIYGFLFGIIIYGFYSFTNYALIQNWDLNIVIMDTLWGGVYISITLILLHYIEMNI